jgi:Right handed beta helix region
MRIRGLLLLFGVAFLSIGVQGRLLESFAVPGVGRVFYVSTRGSDSWSGRLTDPNASRTDGPFRTLDHARDVVRELKSKGAFSGPVTVYVRGGRYDFDHPLVFTPADSGADKALATYAAYRGEKPVLSGGRPITGWKRVRGAGIPAARGHLWTARIPAVWEGKWYFHELFVNGQRRQRARSPNSGFFHAEGEISPESPARFIYHEGDIKAAWASDPDVEVIGPLRWAEYRLHIASVDGASRLVTLAGNRQPWGNPKDPRYWVENTLDALDTPGEWYLDRRSAALYYCPMPGEDPRRAEIIAPEITTLVRFEGDPGAGNDVHDIALRGFTLAYTDWSLAKKGYVDMQASYDIPAAVEAEGAHRCAIEQCRLAHLGQYAVEFHRGSKHNRVIGCEMTDLGAGGVKIGDPEIPKSENETTLGNIISDNHIHDIGIVYAPAVGVWIGQSSDNTIAHNEINDTFYSGISAGWTWGYGPSAARGNVIEFNNIHDIGRGMLSDMGCIYTLGIQPGTVERNNICHDVTRYEKEHGGWGLYTDEGSSDILIENNLVYRIEDGGFLQHYGANNTFRNNIIAFGNPAQFQVIRGKEEDHLSFTFEHNIVYWQDGKDGGLLGGAWSDNHYKLDYDVYFRLGGGPLRFGKWTLEQWQQHGQDVHSLIADPQFRDPAHDDFSLLPSSPALKMGFKPLDMDQVGPRKDFERDGRN